MIESQLLSNNPAYNLRDMPNICIENRRRVVVNNPDLEEVATSMNYDHENHYCSKWDDQEIASSKTFDIMDSESNETFTWSYSLDRGCTEWDNLEIETSTTFDKDEDDDKDYKDLVLDLEIFAASAFDDDELLSDDEGSLE